MKNMTKLSLILLPVASITSVLLSGCEKKTEVIEPSHYTLDTYNFKEIYKNSGSFKFDVYDENHPSECKKVTYKINRSIGEYNYIKIDVETDCNLVGWITYQDEEDGTKMNTEKFFIRETETEFTSFLDAFRKGAFGAFNKKKVLTITFQSVDSSKEGTMTFKKFSVGDKEYYRERMYIDDGTIKLGTSVGYGGAVEWLERIDIDVIEYIDAGGNVRIDKDMDPGMVNSSRLISTSVNLVNIFDLGREIQPSYYLTVNKDANGYEPLTPYKYDSLSGTFSYNPIQCGGVGDIANNIVTEPQVIDYIYKENEIYFKTKGQDWMFVNDQAQGYIESRYYFGHDGVLLVDNSYLDFYQFTNLNSTNNPMSGQETPATYFVYPLNYFYCETKSRNIYDPYVGAQGSGASVVEDAISSTGAPGSYFYGMKAGILPEKFTWCAFVNDQKFGAGIFMPNADYIIASRGEVSCQYANNKSYTKRFFDFGDAFTPSYAASNYNYLNPQVRRRMVEFIPLEYTYALYIGDTSEMKEAFTLAKKEGLTNEKLTMTEGTWPRR